MATAELQSSLAAFVTFARSLKGDEKSEAQLFLDPFFRALGQGGDKFDDDDGLRLPKRPLPLDNLDQQILCADSLFTD